jgi:hypothetical protein
VLKFSKKYFFFQKYVFLKQNQAFDEIFENTLFVKMKSSKLIHYLRVEVVKLMHFIPKIPQ